jgi:hypothetical protein
MATSSGHNEKFMARVRKIAIRQYGTRDGSLSHHCWKTFDKSSLSASNGCFAVRKQQPWCLPQPSENDVTASQTQSSVAMVYSYIRVP